MKTTEEKIEKTATTFVKFLVAMAIILIILVYVSTCVMWYDVFVSGQYYAHSTVLMAVLFGAYPIYGGVTAFFICKMIYLAKQLNKQ